MKHYTGWNLDLDPQRFPSLSCGFFTDLTQILHVILACFKFKFQITKS
jgi:hypothetical protein